LPFLELKGIVPIVLSNKVWHKIQYLCTNINKVEWSGCIVYKIEGRLDKVESIFVEVLDLIPLDKGTTGFTSYHFDERVLKFILNNDYLEYKIGHIHSHHDMKTFFSGTDLDEVNENSEHIKPYLSIIVNNAYDFSAKLAFRMKRLSSTAYQYQDISNQLMTLELPQENDYVANYNCKVITPKALLEVDSEFIEQFTEINKPKVVPVNKQIGFHSDFASWNTHFDKPKKSKHEEQLEFLFDDDSMFIEEIKSQEKLFCSLMRLGVEIENDTFEQALEDIETCVKTDKEFNLEQYAYSISSNFEKIVSDHLKSNPNSKKYKDNVGFIKEMFFEELFFSSRDFSFVDELLAILESFNLFEAE
jgi:hypothetical protein